MSSTATCMASSEIRTLSLSTVHPDTHTPALPSILMTRELVPEILKNKPNNNGSALVALLHTKASMLMARTIAYEIINM